MLVLFAAACLALAWLGSGCEPSDDSFLESCHDRIRVHLESQAGPIPTGTYTFSMAPGNLPGLAAVCSLPNSLSLEDCEARTERLTLRAKTQGDLITIDLLAAPGELDKIETYDISVILDGKILIAQTQSTRFNPYPDSAQDPPLCYETDDSLSFP